LCYFHYNPKKNNDKVLIKKKQESRTLSLNYSKKLKMTYKKNCNNDFLIKKHKKIKKIKKKLKKVLTCKKKYYIYNPSKD